MLLSLTLTNNKDEPNDEKIVNFVTKYISCQIPYKALSPILHDRVTKYQQHCCNQYCLHSKKLKQVFIKFVGLVFQGLNVTQFASVAL